MRFAFSMFLLLVLFYAFKFLIEIGFNAFFAILFSPLTWAAVAIGMWLVWFPIYKLTGANKRKKSSKNNHLSF